MYQTQPLTPNEPLEDDSVIETPRATLLNGTHWLYIQKRYSLSPRERQVAELVCSGFSNDEIAGRLKIKNGTVKTHLRNIYRRIRVRNKITMLLKFVAEAASFSVSSQTPPPTPTLEIYKTKNQPPK